mmetsp:Transcript_26255/g.52624  ORF Transcript_26255/g.52624 Transcript_26255/m.52624 type:complete len:260 (+) Transcript_26255:14-793(+)
MTSAAAQVALLAGFLYPVHVNAFYASNSIVKLAQHKQFPAPSRMGNAMRHSNSIRMSSGIDTLPLALQSATFLGTMSGITAGGLVLAGPVFEGAEKTLGGNFQKWKSTWPLLGFLFILAGAAHFSSSDAFKGVYPPLGTWGLWQLPGSADFHVAWTGVAEILGGSGLVAGGLSELAPEQLRADLRKLRKFSAAALFLLTVCVTPANIYMWTHNVQMVGMGPPGDIPVSFHYVRGFLQVVILGFLGNMAAADPELRIAEE